MTIILKISNYLLENDFFLFFNINGTSKGGKKFTHSNELLNIKITIYIEINIFKMR